MLLLNAAEGKMVMRVLLYYSVLQFSSVWIFVVPSFTKFDDQVVGWRRNTCCIHSNGTTAAIATPDGGVLHGGMRLIVANNAGVCN